MVNFPAVLLDHFRCSLCYSALSVGPVRCGPDGATVCGRCPSSQDDVPNPPLQALLAGYSFPCRYAAKGCEKILPFGDVRHEPECQFQEVVTYGEAFETIDPLILENCKCCDCKKILTVGPLKLTAQGNRVCGRCGDRWSELYGERTLVRNWKMELLMKKLPLKCSYYKEGCRRALKWGTVQKHEDFCHFRPYNCPATPHDSCQAVLPAANLFQHFEREHPTLVLETPKFEENLTKDKEMHRLLKLNEDLYLIMTKIKIAENRLWLSVSHIGDIDAAKHLLFNLKIFNTEETVYFTSAPKPVQPDLVLRMNQETSIPINLEGFQEFFRQKNLQDFICSISVSQDGSPPKKPMLKSCKWGDCKHIGVEGKMSRHEDTCEDRVGICKWPLCGLKMSHRLLVSHETNCDHRIFSCKWSHCKQEIPANQKASHEARCGESRVKCRFQDCRICCTIKDWDRHVTQCEHRYEGKYRCDISGCSERLPPPALACHVLSNHPADIIEGAMVTRTHKRGVGWNDDVYMQYDGLLFWGRCEFCSDGHAEFSLGLGAVAKFRAEYKCAIKVFHPSDPHQTITRDADCCTSIEITADVLAPFMQKDQIKFEWNIIKK